MRLSVPKIRSENTYPLSLSLISLHETAFPLLNLIPVEPVSRCSDVMLRKNVSSLNVNTSVDVKRNDLNASRRWMHSEKSFRYAKLLFLVIAGHS